MQVLRSPVLAALLHCMALEQWASAKLCHVVQGMELRNFHSSSFSTEGATYIPRAVITFGIVAHSSFCGSCTYAGGMLACVHVLEQDQDFLCCGHIFVVSR